MSVTIYHKPECSKSCEALSILKGTKEKVEIINYIEHPPSKKLLRDLLKKLGMKAEQLVRKKEPLFREKFEGRKFTQAEWIDILVKNPILIERPIIVKGDKAIIARPPELAEQFLNA